MFRAASSASGIRPSPQALSIGGRRESATKTRNPSCRAAIAAASPAGPPPITRRSVSYMFPLDTDRPAGDRQRLAPEFSRRMHALDDFADRIGEMIEVRAIRQQRRRGFQHHKIVAADLRQN